MARQNSIFVVSESDCLEMVDFMDRLGRSRGRKPVYVRRFYHESPHVGYVLPVFNNTSTIAYSYAPFTLKEAKAAVKKAIKTGR